ncbi:MAG: hypothetical protein PHR06_15760, partial [Candidatus Cloacimonetes bacterium]|nr:hypothetical protein [Candidatus Cloacimonadota bacterium]
IFEKNYVTAQQAVDSTKKKIQEANKSIKNLNILIEAFQLNGDSLIGLEDLSVQNSQDVIAQKNLLLDTIEKELLDSFKSITDFYVKESSFFKQSIHQLELYASAIMENKIVDLIPGDISVLAYSEESLKRINEALIKIVDVDPDYIASLWEQHPLRRINFQYCDYARELPKRFLIFSHLFDAVKTYDFEHRIKTILDTTRHNLYDLSAVEETIRVIWYWLSFSKQILVSIRSINCHMKIEE